MQDGHELITLGSVQKLIGTLSCLLLLLGACGEAMPVEPPEDPTLRNGGEVAYVEVYEAVNYTGFGTTREWYPRDVARHPSGALWVVQQMERDPAYDDDTECTTRGFQGEPSDCVSTQGSTVGLADPMSMEAATADNGRANLVVDANAVHFMRRPSGIAFGATELRLDPTDPGAAETGITEPIVFRDTFATCHEAWTGNPTDTAAFIGPSLWTSDPAIYNGSNGSFEWSNGSHLDMVHATQYCMGIAYETGNVYWTFNGAEGTLDRYDFGAPHFQGHSYHEDADVTRFFMPEGDELERLPYVPSNMELVGRSLYVADTGNGRVLRFDLDNMGAEFGTFRTFENIEGSVFDGMAYEVLLDAATLGAEWNGASEPSGLAMLDEQTLVVANHATGHVSLFDLDGTLVRTIDTGRGAGLGGMTVIDGHVFFVQMTERKIYRIDVQPLPVEG